MGKTVVSGLLIILVFMVSLFAPEQTQAATKADIDRMTSYAVIIGRATACGVDTENALRRVGAWMDRRFPPGSSDQKTYLPIFVKGVQYHAEQQAKGNNPDSCSQVRSTFRKMQWP